MCCFPRLSEALCMCMCLCVCVCAVWTCKYVLLPITFARSCPRSGTSWPNDGVTCSKVISQLPVYKGEQVCVWLLPPAKESVWKWVAVGLFCNGEGERKGGIESEREISNCVWKYWYTGVLWCDVLCGDLCKVSWCFHSTLIIGHSRYVDIMIHRLIRLLVLVTQRLHTFILQEQPRNTTCRLENFQHFIRIQEEHPVDALRPVSTVPTIAWSWGAGFTQSGPAKLQLKKKEPQHVC